jgi:hypothetical protein
MVVYQSFEGPASGSPAMGPRLSAIKPLFFHGRRSSVVGAKLSPSETGPHHSSDCNGLRHPLLERFVARCSASNWQTGLFKEMERVGFSGQV